MISYLELCPSLSLGSLSIIMLTLLLQCVSAIIKPPLTDLSHSDNRSSRRSWQHRSRSRSSSSDSTSSTSSSHGRGRKRSRQEWNERGPRQTSGEGGRRSGKGEGVGDGEKKDGGVGEGENDIKRRRCKDYDGNF